MNEPGGPIGAPEGLLLLLVSALTDGHTVADLPQYALTAAVRALGCDGGAVTLEPTEPHRVTLVATDDVARAVEDAQEIATQGPTFDSYRSGDLVSLVLDGDGDGDPLDERWPLLMTTTLLDLAPLAVHATPLRSTGRAFGVLTLVRRSVADELDGNAARRVARLVAATVLASSPTEPTTPPLGPWSARAAVHQAVGMLVARHRIGEDDAMALLRAHAFASGTGLDTTAQAVVSRRLRLDAPGPEEETE